VTRELRSAPTLEETIGVVRSRIEAACDRARRDPRGVSLVAVTKTVSIEAVRRARQLGIEHFGENHANDLAAKASAVPATWHFLGKLQYGTAPRVALHADVVHSAEPGRGLRRMARRAAEAGRQIESLIQVDFAGGHQGVGPEEVDDLLGETRGIAGIRTVGLMTMPPWTGDPDDTRPFFVRLRQLRDRLRERWPDLVELSMGMSGDYDVAVEEGATMVRVGTALFGARPGRSVPGVADGHEAP
jgi:pyridoxal phosphate enzyme (YggS family)